ncbi:cation-transporting P-type ATPase, partial [Xanthomonas translucens pv. undulosa]
MNETLLARSRHKNHHHQTSAALSMRAAREANNDLNTTLTILKASLDGLTDADANLRLQENGPNET